MHSKQIISRVVNLQKFFSSLTFYQKTNQNVGRNKSGDKNTPSCKIDDWKQHNEEASHDRMPNKSIVEDCDEAVRNESREFSHFQSLSQSEKFEMVDRKSGRQKPKNSDWISDDHENLQNFWSCKNDGRHWLPVFQSLVEEKSRLQAIEWSFELLKYKIKSLSQSAKILALLS